MTQYILPLSDPHATLENVGGKGMSLAKLARAGLPVPGGYHITTEAYRQFVAANDIQRRLLETLKGIDVTDDTVLEEISNKISLFFSEGTMPVDMAGEIETAYKEMKGVPVAVRSSATAEDLPGASFAGQQETYLNIRGVEAVLQAVKRCWASLWTGRAITYRARQGIAPENVALAVVVQEMVFADAAGVMFTANPINGKRDEMMITAAWGLGEAIVSGAVTPDTITVDKSSGRPGKVETAAKQVMTVRTETGTRDQPVPRKLINKSVLNAKQITELAKLGMAIEALYQAAMDIEWTIAKGQFAIVQARPITALPDPPLEWPLPGPKVILARGSFGEFLPDPISPLFATLAVPIATQASRAMMSDAFGAEDPGFYIVEVINGYLYTGMKLTPKTVLATLVNNAPKLKQLLVGGKERWQVIREKYLALTRRWQARDVKLLPASELLAGVKEIFTLTSGYYAVIQSGTIPTSLTSETLFSKFYDLFARRKGELAAPIFLFGSENQALRAEKSLFDLAMWVKAQSGLAENILQRPAEQICNNLGAATGNKILDEFQERFTSHLAEFGHAFYDLDFAKPVPADHPESLVEAIQSYLRGTASNPYERQQGALQRREEMTQAVVDRLDPLRRKWFLKLLKWAQSAAPLREDSIADLSLGYPQIRIMLAELGKRLADGGAMASAADIYWIEAQELIEMVEALDNGEVLPQLVDQVESRRNIWHSMRKITPPGSLPANNWMTKLMPAENQLGDLLKGIGASAGKVTAPACVLRGPEDFSRLQPGDVLVAVITTPAWTTLFGRAAAVVTDIGGPLSHSSIVAREYGIPAVLATGNGTRRIQNGQMITVDGGAGTVDLSVPDNLLV